MITLAAFTAIGAEKALCNEIKALGYSVDTTKPGRVAYIADEIGIYRSNICLRTADKVFLQAASFKCANFDDLYDGIFAVPWQDFLKKNARILIKKARCNKSDIFSERSAQAVAQKAVCDKLCAVWRMNSLPETGDPAEIRVYIDKNGAAVLLDVSGESLYRRGYRSFTGIAPLRETCAAALLFLSNWRRKIPLHDPCCGSGVIISEAALYAYNIAPGLGREFGVKTLAIFNADAERKARDAAAEAIRPDCKAQISGSDIDPRAVSYAKINAEHALSAAGRALQSIGVDARLPRPEFFCADAAALSSGSGPFSLAPPGLLLTNAPYGERLGDKEQTDALYVSMGRLRDNFSGWKLGVLTARGDFSDFFGLKEVKKKPLRNGNLQTWLYSFEL